MLSRVFLAIGAGFLLVSNLASATPTTNHEINLRDLASDQAALSSLGSNPGSGKCFQVELYADMTIPVNDGRENQLYRVATAQAYAVFNNSEASNTDLRQMGPNAQHQFSLWPERVNFNGVLIGGRIIINDTYVQLQNGLGLDPRLILQGPDPQWAMVGYSEGFLPILPPMNPPNDNFIVSSLDWRSSVDQQYVHLFARRDTSQAYGILRFGGPRPDFPSLNVTAQGDGECFAVISMGSETSENMTSFEPVIQVDFILEGGYSIYDDGVYVPTGYQIDTLYPFIQIASNDTSVLQSKILDHYVPPGHFDPDGMVVVQCDAYFNGNTSIRIGINEFEINQSKDMVVFNALGPNESRCYSAYQMQHTHGVLKLGRPLLYNVGVTFDFVHRAYIITSRPYYDWP